MKSLTCGPQGSTPIFFKRGLRYDQGLLVVIDGAKALRAAVRAVFGKQAVVQRCTVHSVSRSMEALDLGKEGKPAA